MNVEDRLRSHYESLSRVIWFIRSADAKAAPVLALQVALVGTLAARSESLLTIIAQSSGSLEQVALVALTSSYSLFLIAAVTMAAWVYLPMNPRTGQSLIYFEDIAAMDYQLFEAKARDLSPYVLERQLLDQIHRVSVIASAKMHRVRWALLLSLPSGILWLVLMAWGSMLNQRIID